MVIQPNNGQTELEAAQEFISNVALVDDVCNAYAVEIGVPPSWVTCTATLIQRRLAEGHEVRRLTVSTNVQLEVSVVVPDDSATTAEQVVTVTDALTVTQFETFVGDALDANGVSTITLVQVGEVTPAIIVGTTTTIAVSDPGDGGGTSGASAGIIVLIIIIVLLVLLCPLVGFLYYKRQQNHGGGDSSFWPFGSKNDSAPLANEGGAAGQQGQSGWVDHDV